MIPRAFATTCTSVLAALAIAASTIGANADEFSLTGTYQGFVVCDDVTGGESGAFGRAMTMDVVQSGDRVEMRNTVAVDPEGPPSHTVFQGRVTVAPGVAAISGYVEACQSSFPHKELARILPASPARQPFSFSADTVFVTDSLPGVATKLVVESCKWSLTRLSTETPQFESCP